MNVQCQSKDSGINLSSLNVNLGLQHWFESAIIIIVIIQKHLVLPFYIRQWALSWSCEMFGFFRVLAYAAVCNCLFTTAESKTSIYSWREMFWEMFSMQVSQSWIFIVVESTLECVCQSSDTWVELCQWATLPRRQKAWERIANTVANSFLASLKVEIQKVFQLTVWK